MVRERGEKGGERTGGGGSRVEKKKKPGTGLGTVLQFTAKRKGGFTPPLKT